MIMKSAICVALAATANTVVAAQEPATNAGDTPQAVTLVTEIAGDPVERRPLARLRSPLCLTVAAQDDRFARTVAKRIIDNAKAAGVPTSRAGCRANALVTFSADARAQLETIRADDGKVFRRMSKKENEAALITRDPVYVFQTVQHTPRIGEGDADGFDPSFQGNWTKERSPLRAPQDLVTTMVVIDESAVSGLNAVQMADYVTLRLLAPTGEIDAGAADAPRTILSLFAAPQDAPRKMTSTDRAYLKSLYTLPRTAFASEVLEETAKIAGN